jgi:protein-arginine kinase
LTQAFSVSSKEALNLLSVMPLGIDLGFFPEEGRVLTNLLLMETQTGTSSEPFPAEAGATTCAPTLSEKLP